MVKPMDSQQSFLDRVLIGLHDNTTTTNIGQNGVSLLSFPSMSPLSLISAALQVARANAANASLVGIAVHFS